jgi:hypothetical protein
MIWPYCFILFFLFRQLSIKKLILFAIFQIQFLLTTHRTSIILSYLILAFFILCYREKIKTSFSIVATALLTILTVFSLNSLHSDVPFWRIFGLEQFSDALRTESIIANRNHNRSNNSSDDKAQSEVNHNHFSPIGHARGRTGFWANHSRWIASQPFKNLLLGSSYPMPEVYGEKQPHNQILDLIERIGLVGLVVFVLFFVLALKSTITAFSPLTLSLLGSFLVYSLITETFVSPSFPWFFFLSLILANHLEREHTPSPRLPSS